MNEDGTMLLIVIATIHIILTFAMYKIKGGGYACFYFFLVPIALLLLVLKELGKAGGSPDSERKHIDVTHHYRW
jgi:hypothetical protein